MPAEHRRTTYINAHAQEICVRWRYNRGAAPEMGFRIAPTTATTTTLSSKCIIQMGIRPCVWRAPHTLTKHYTWRLHGNERTLALFAHRPTSTSTSSSAASLSSHRRNLYVWPYCARAHFAGTISVKLNWRLDKTVRINRRRLCDVCESAFCNAR